jgi:hypothetical protein
LQLVQSALPDTTLLEVILGSLDDLLDDLQVDVALFLSISYCDIAHPDRHRGRSQHTTSAFVMAATVRKEGYEKLAKAPQVIEGNNTALQRCPRCRCR